MGFFYKKLLDDPLDILLTFLELSAEVIHTNIKGNKNKFE